MKALTTLFMIGMFATAVGMADDADDVKAVVREHFATLNAGNQVAHIQQHHIPVFNRFTINGLRNHFDSIEEQQQQIQSVFDQGSKYNLSLTDVEVSVFGDSAVLSGYVVGSILRPNGNTTQRTDRYSAMLVKQGGQWKTVHAHASALRIPPPQ
jgi:ketosteroid isomerase-like protein